MAFPPFAVTVDLVVFTIRDDQLCLLVIERSGEPFAGKFALPGGFVQVDEDLPTAASRELAAKAGVSSKSELARIHLEQLGTYGHPKRDPRMRTVTVAYLAFAAQLPEPVAGVDGAAAQWMPVADAIKAKLAFDHATILSDGLERARAKLEYTTLAASFCADEFTVADVRHVYEMVWDVSIDPRNFHRKVMASEGFIEPIGTQTSQGRGRPAQLFRRGEAKQLHPPIAR